MSLSDERWKPGEGRFKTLDEMKDKETEDTVSRQATPPLPAHSRHTSSKYDFVKAAGTRKRGKKSTGKIIYSHIRQAILEVKVWLGDNADHYYILSRFLVSRMLTVTKIPNHVAIKISLELKKLLIDNSLFDVSQSDLETNLFKLMERRGFGEEYINRYKMMTRFHHQRVPLVILVCGTACVGKSTVATQLAQRLNLPNVLQTDMVYELIRTSTDAPLPSTPIWEREFESQEELVTEFARECRIVRKGLNGDLKKAMKDGKPIIIEGIHLDPSIYLLDEECSDNASQRALSARLEAGSGALRRNSSQQTGSLSEHNDGLNIAEQHSALSLLRSNQSASDKAACPVFEEQAEISMRSSLANRLKDMNSFENNTNTGGTNAGPQSIPGELVGGSFPEEKSKRTSAKAIIVPIVLRMDEFDHKTLLEEWIACRSTVGSHTDEAKTEALLIKLMTIQDYLCSFKSQGIIVRNVSATTFPQTLDALHSYLLQCIEECQSKEQSHAKQSKVSS